MPSWWRINLPGRPGAAWPSRATLRIKVGILSLTAWNRDCRSGHTTVMKSEAQLLLSETPGHNGFIATVDADGMPRTVPVWYRWDGQQIHITAQEAALWINNLLRDGRVGFSVAEDGPPYRAVVIQGQAVVKPANEDETRRIFARYMDAQEVDEYYAALQNRRGVMVRILPDSVKFRRS